MTPEIGCHVGIDSPQPVSRVNPPTSTIAAVILLSLTAAVLVLLHVSAGPIFAVLSTLLLLLLFLFAAFIEEAVRPIQTLANVVAALRAGGPPALARLSGPVREVRNLITAAGTAAPAREPEAVGR